MRGHPEGSQSREARWLGDSPSDEGVTARARWADGLLTEVPDSWGDCLTSGSAAERGDQQHCDEVPFSSDFEPCFASVAGELHLPLLPSDKPHAQHSPSDTGAGVDS